LLASVVVAIAKAIIALIVMIITKPVLLEHLENLQLSIVIDQLKMVKETQRVMRYLQLLYPFGLNNLEVLRNH